jgi:UDP-glucose 4-epimerase
MDSKKIPMIVAITGGNGFLGSNLAKKFIDKGHKVYVLDKSENKFCIKNKKAIYKKCDLTNFKSLSNIDIAKVDILLHCAGQPSAALSFNDPELDLKVNILGTLNIIKWARLKKVKKIIFASTFNVYDENNKKPKLSEKDFCQPKSLYAVSKLSAENYIRCYAKYLNIKWVIMRMFNIYGPGQDPTNKFLGMINIFLNMAIKEPAIKIKGSLNRFRDFIFIDDVAEAWYKAAISEKANSKIYNLGIGKKTSISKLLEVIFRTINKKSKIIELKGTPGDFNGCYANISKIKKDLKFKPKTSLKKGILNFYNWSKLEKI